MQHVRVGGLAFALCSQCATGILNKSRPAHRGEFQRRGVNPTPAQDRRQIITPLGLFRIEIRICSVQFDLTRGDGLTQCLNTRLIFILKHTKNGRRIHHVAIHGGLRGVVEKSKQLVELTLRNGVVLVVMARSAPRGQAQPNGAKRFHPVHGVLDQILLVDGPPLARGDMRTNKSCGDLLVLGWLRQQIARQLLDGERIKGLVLIDGIHHPIAVLPHPAFVVEMKTMGVRVAGGVQPDPAQVLPVRWHGQRNVNRPFPRQRSIKESLDLIGGGRQSSEVKEQSTELPLWSSPRVGRQPRRRHLLVQKGIDGMIKARRDGQRRSNWRFPRPMGVVRSAGRDPAAQNVHFRSIQPLVQFRGRHQLVRIVVHDPLQNLARLHVSGDQRPRGNGLCTQIQTKSGFASCCIGTMTGKTPVRQQRPHIPVEIRHFAFESNQKQCDDHHGLSLLRKTSSDE